MCKQHDNQQAVQVKLGSTEELTVSAENFEALFHTYFVDESVYWFGSTEAKAALSAELEQQLAAMRICIEADRPRPSVPLLPAVA